MKNESVFQKKPVMVISAVLVCVLWASAGPVTKLSYAQLAIANEFQRLLLTGIRFTLAGVGILLFERLGMKKKVLPQRAERPVIGLVSLLMYASYVLFAIGMGHIDGVKSGVLATTGVFFVPVFSCLLMKGDRLDKKQWVGVLLGFLGVLAANFSIFSGTFTFAVMGEGFILLHIILLSLNLILIRKYAPGIDVVKLNGWQFMISGMMISATGLIGYPKAFVMDAASLGLLLYLSAIAGVTFTVWFVLLKYYSASVLEQYKFMIPLVGSVISVAILPGEHIGLEMLIAAAFVAAGVYIVTHQETVKTRAGIAASPPPDNKNVPL